MTVKIVEEGTMKYVVQGGHVAEKILTDNGYFPTVRIETNHLRQDVVHPFYYASNILVIYQNTDKDQIVGTMPTEDKRNFIKVLFKQPFEDYLRTLGPKDLPYIFSSFGETPDGEKVIKFNVPVYESKIVSKLVDRKMKTGLGIKPTQEYHYEVRPGGTERYMIFKDIADYAHFLFTFSSFISPAGWERPVNSKC